MNILMVTNTYEPHVGGVARSVSSFVAAYRELGHSVLVVAPEFPETLDTEQGVFRIPAIQNFNGSDFSVRLPIPTGLYAALEEFNPDIVHSHHPFLLGDTAVRIASVRGIPLVFTHHTLYEQYTHYVPGDSPRLKEAVISLATGYANLCHCVIAPSESIRDLLLSRGVTVPIEVIPTGIDVERFSKGDRAGVRSQLGIPADNVVLGHVGRLAPEKNLTFLSNAVRSVLESHPTVHLLVVGDGPSKETIATALTGLTQQVHLVGTKQGQELIDCYHAMDVFLFSSRSETQGLVVAEAMSVPMPVIALDATGVREVVVDGSNGRLLPGQDLKTFTKAIEEYLQRPEDERAELRDNAAVTAKSFSTAVCAKKALELYTSAIAEYQTLPSAEESAWSAGLRLAESEWSLIGTRYRAVKRYISLPTVLRALGLRGILPALRTLRQKCSRGEWAIRLLRLSCAEGAATEPGLVLIQIDGLAHAEVARALRQGRMRFLRHLITQEGYLLQPMYSGLPSTTPAVQAELYYGISTAVPAFQFYRRDKNQRIIMFDPIAAELVEGELRSGAFSLLHNGSSFSNIYTGIESEASFCSATLGWSNILHQANPLSAVLLLFAYFSTVLRALLLCLLEMLLAIADFIQGGMSRSRFLPELRFIPARVAICILLREVILAGALVDIRRGKPIILLNFLGYDEQSHRRGPTSHFAHWTLKGIDRGIKSLWKAAARSPRRSYDVWIFSDHGQESTTPYDELHGEPVAEAIRRVCQRTLVVERREPRTETSLHAAWSHRRRPLSVEPDSPPPDDAIIVTALGPIGHIYFQQRPSDEELALLAERLRSEAKIPAVLYIDSDSRAVVLWNDRRAYLPEEAEQFLGPEHPWSSSIAADLVALVTHRDSGDILICGWTPDAPPVTFALEYGSHAAMGPNETTAFTITPPGAIPTANVRPQTLRNAALEYLSGTTRIRSVQKSTDAIRLATYNIHSCIGTDQKLSPFRIARILAGITPDIIALQEVDVGRARSGYLDQAFAIAHELEMQVQFNATFRVAEEEYGNAILSRYPLEVVHAAALPHIPNAVHTEPRGALLARVTVSPDCVLYVLTTHLGLSPKERSLQVQALLSPAWIGRVPSDAPLLLCGDFNFGPRSPSYRLLTSQLVDAQLAIPGRKAEHTWFSRFPLNRIDHVFTSPSIRISSCAVVKNSLTRMASDHLPLYIDMERASIERTASPKAQEQRSEK